MFTLCGLPAEPRPAIASPAADDAEHGSFVPSGTQGISVRRWIDTKPPRGRLNVELRNDRDETVGFRVTIWINAAEKRTREVLQVATGEIRPITLQGSAMDRVVVENVRTETQRHRALDGTQPLWKTADVILAKGTTSVRFHLNDIYTYKDDRKVRAAMTVIKNVVAVGGGVTANLGWGTWVYPDAYASTSGKKNPSFFFGVGQLCPSGAPLAGGEALVDGRVWELEIKIDSSGSPNYLGLKGLDGELIVDSPRPLYRDRLPNAIFKLGVGGKTRLRFSVSPE